MNGATLLLDTLIAAGVDTCFANPGTTEIPLVTAMDTAPQIRAVLGLFEGVCTGAADGYGRMTDRPAMTLLHLGPGLANGIANLHNAKKAGTPVLNIIGEHATWHRDADPPLAMDIESLASTVSGWYRTNASVGTLSRDAAEAVAGAMKGQISSLIVPHNHMYAESQDNTVYTVRHAFEPISRDVVEKAGRLVTSGKKIALLLGGRALRSKGLAIAARLQAGTGCDLFADPFPWYMERGITWPDVNRLPYFPEEAIDILSRYDAFVLAGMREPVTFFGYEGTPGRLIRDNREKVHICTGKQDVIAALEALENATGTARAPVTASRELVRPGLPQGKLTGEKVSAVVASLLPENAILVDEGITTFFPFNPLSAHIVPYTHLTITGGAIGYGMPCAIGAAIACPERQVINIEADGSAMYTVQSLWTQAREGLNVKTFICSNRSYNIVKMELLRAGITSLGPSGKRLTELDHPSIDWVGIARGMGVPAVSVDTAEDLVKEFQRILREPGPSLVEMLL